MTVTNPDSQSGVIASAYAYVNTPAPTITAVAPARAPLAGGVAVTITGTNFVAGATVKFGAIVATVTALSATSVTATAPAGTSSVGVTVTNPDNDAATLAAAFKYVAAPTVKSVTPAKVSKEGGATLTISGTGFETGATVTVGGVAATGVKFVSASQITAVAPAGSAASQAVVVKNTDLQLGTLAAAVTYITPPRA
ncbi:MAG: IPT/TIG domain-containing protein [Chloroflexi bacterium]|nr:IPT/TIG domain-containing protein [Chloroflexota bacterium]